MHDPMVVAFEIHRPWPYRTSHVQPGVKVGETPPRWSWRGHGRWWRPGAWSPFVTAFGVCWYFPSLITVWHVEPGGRDSGVSTQSH